MATSPEDDKGGDFSYLAGLAKKVEELERQNSKLNIALMLKSAEASEAREELRRLKLEWEIVADQTGHNLCWVAIAKALKVTIGHTGKYPDPDNVSSEQFAHGCVDFHRDLFPRCGVSLVVIPQDLKDKGMLTEEQAEIIGERLGFRG